jgi:hypothetical protein
MSCENPNEVPVGSEMCVLKLPTPSLRTVRCTIARPALSLSTRSLTPSPAALAFINARPKPLALYCFSNDRRCVERVVQHTRSGGVTINGTMLHATQDDLPFGGVGESGTGAYHGHDGFVRLSHARGVFKLSPFNMSDKVAAPYGRLTRLVTRLMLGK